MAQIFNIDFAIVFVKMFFKIMFALVCLVNIMLLLSPMTFDKVNKKLQRKYGPKKSMISWLERDIMTVDEFLFKHRKVVGAVSLITSIILFTIY